MKSILLSATLLLAILEEAIACGGFVCQPQQPVLQAGESIAFGVEQLDDTTVAVQMAVQIQYEGPAEAFAWLLPVPAAPDLTVGSDLLFRGFFDATVPSFTFEIDQTQSTTCTSDMWDAFACPESQPGFAGDGDVSTPTDEAEDDEAVVVEEGTVGPFQFVTLESAESRPESVFEWLEENGYDQPQEARPLVDYYASMNMKFVALQLLKESETGDIRPIILKYQIPGNLARTPVACVPIQLTSIAATLGMPIQVYTLAPSRGVPKNYIHADLDLRYLDWLGCSSQGFVDPGPNCYINDLRNMLEVASDSVNGHTFITEYAGSTEIARGSIALTGVELTVLQNLTDPLEFLNYISEATVPAIPLVHTIIERHIPNQMQNSEEVPPSCLSLPNIYTPSFQAWQMNTCVEFVDFGRKPFDPVALGAELQEEVFQPAIDAQNWVNSYPYLTRMYAQLDPEEMSKDPFFAFNEQLPDVSNQIGATAVPVCDAVGPIGLDISLNDAPPLIGESIFVEASLECGIWFRRDSGPIFGDQNPAYSFTGYNFTGLSGSILLRDPETGQFLQENINNLISVLDDSVPSQEIAEDPEDPDEQEPAATNPPSEISGVTTRSLLGGATAALAAAMDLAD